MKSKIAKLAVGISLMAAAVASAVSVDSTGLSGYPFFSNGEPAVKVVVGSKAMPSDGVVAANIAAMLGNLAYTAKEVSVVGKDTLSCGAGTGSTSTCAVEDASKKVSFSVTVPGASPANVYTMRTYINDYLDNQSETTRSASSFNFYDGGTTTARGLRVTKEKSQVVSLPSDGLVSNPRNRNVKQEQNIYLGSYSHYDTSTTYKQVIADKMRASYVLTFSEALPTCWDVSKSFTACPDSDKLNMTHTYINFLGSKWVVIDYTITSGSVTAIQLGKETAYSPYMNIDDEISASNGAKVKLKSVSPFGYGTGGSSLPYASFEVTSPTGTVTTETLQPGESKDVAGITLTVNKVFPGVNNVNYADVSLFADKLTLTNNQQIDSTTHQYWYASIAGVADSSTSPSTVTSITIYSTYPYVKSDDKWKPGETLPIIRGANAFTFTYEGLDDASVTYDTLNFNVQNGTIPYNASSKWSGPFVEVTSAVSNAFQNGSTSRSVVRIALQNLTGDVGLGNAWIGSGFIQDTEGFWKPFTGSTYGVAPVNGAVTYYYSASEYATIGVAGNTNGAFGRTNATVWVKEYDEDSLAGTPEYIEAYFDPNLGSAGQFADAAASTVTSKIAYGSTAPGTGQATIATSPTYETGFVTQRGVKFSSIGTTSLALQYPKTVVKAKYTLKASGTNATSGAVSCDNIAVGGTCIIDSGYVATVSGIAATAGGAAGACALTGKDTLVASPSSAAVVAELNTQSNPLVVLDSAASSTEPLIVVGGPVVNSMAANAGLPASAGEQAVVKVEGGKIYVAGYSAQDTMDAGAELVKWLANNRATLVG